MPCCDQPDPLSSTLCRCSALRPGVNLFDAWEVQECLGGSRQVRSYLVHHRHDTTQRLHAMEYVLVGAGRSIPLIQAMEEEMSLRQGWDHPGLPKVFGQFRSSTLPRWYLLTEWTEGDTLRELIQKKGTPGLPQAQVEMIAHALLEILEYVHAQATTPLGTLGPDSVVRRRSDWGVVFTRFSPGVLRPAATGLPDTPPELAQAGTPHEDLAALGRLLMSMLTGNLDAAGEGNWHPDASRTLLQPHSVDPGLIEIIRRSQLSVAGHGYADAGAMRRALTDRSPERSGRAPETTGRAGLQTAFARPVRISRFEQPPRPPAHSVDAVPVAPNTDTGSQAAPPSSQHAAFSSSEPLSTLGANPECEWTEFPLPENSPLRILFPVELYREIVRHVTESAHPDQPSSTYSEAGGLLFGRVHRFSGVLQVFVESHRPLSTRADGTFALSRADWAASEEALRQNRPDQRVVGVYHSHPGLGIFQSAADRLYLGPRGQCLVEPWHFSLLLDPLTPLPPQARGTGGVFSNGILLGCFSLKAPLAASPGALTPPGATEPAAAPPEAAADQQSARRPPHPRLPFRWPLWVLMIIVAFVLVWKKLLPSWAGMRPGRHPRQFTEARVSLKSVAVGSTFVPEIRCEARNLPGRNLDFNAIRISSGRGGSDRPAEHKAVDPFAPSEDVISPSAPCHPAASTPTPLTARIAGAVPCCKTSFSLTGGRSNAHFAPPARHGPTWPEMAT